MALVRLVRVFLSSPGDVSDERSVALDVLERLQYDPSFRGQIAFDIVAWDKPGADTPLLATMTPQSAINAGLPRPSECDIVVVLLWARLGTPLPQSDYQKPDGSPYLSGTEWEYEDAMRAAREHGRPEIVVYKRTMEVSFPPDDPHFAEKVEQWRRKEQFFVQFSDQETGAIRAGFNTYETPEEFRQRFDSHLRVIVRRLLSQAPAGAARSGEAQEVETPPEEPQVSEAPPTWEGSPFPGLRAFTTSDAPIFFGRGRETDALIQHSNKSRIVTVVGASGSGKSSLVGAGLIPRLQKNALSGSKDWLYPAFDSQTQQWQGLRFTPGETSDNPFVSLAVKLAPMMDMSPAATLADELMDMPGQIGSIAQKLLADRPTWAELFVFIDQFEEFFTVVDPRYQRAFVRLLSQVANTASVRVVLTMRSDFYHRCIDLPELARLLEIGQFPLSIPQTDALLEMITLPAERSALDFEDGLPNRILKDIGNEPGSLALLAYALDELYRSAVADGSRMLTHGMYENIGGVQGAIGRRAQTTFDRLADETQEALPVVFRELVSVDERGVATRQRGAYRQFDSNSKARELVDALTTARLLTQGRDLNGSPVVEVAHESLLRQWPRLATWIDETQDDLRLLRSLRLAATDWQLNGRSPDFLWQAGRLEPVYAMIDRLQPQLDADTYDFIQAEFDQLMAELELAQTPDDRRRAIGRRLIQVGDTRPGVGLRDDRLPDIAWCTVLRSTVEPFRISRYPVTYEQYRTFLNAPDGYRDAQWWDGLNKRQLTPGWQHQRVANFPADNVSWYDAMAFCRWLSINLGFEIRLPSQAEWEIASAGAYKAQSDPDGVDETYSVGLYPHIPSVVGALDMGTIVNEWVLEDGDRDKSDNHPIKRDGLTGFRIVSAVKAEVEPTIPSGGIS